MKFVETEERKQKDGDKHRTEHEPHENGGKCVWIWKRRKMRIHI